MRSRRSEMFEPCRPARRRTTATNRREPERNQSGATRREATETHVRGRPRRRCSIVAVRRMSCSLVARRSRTAGPERRRAMRPAVCRSLPLSTHHSRRGPRAHRLRCRNARRAPSSRPMPSPTRPCHCRSTPSRRRDKQRPSGKSVASQASRAVSVAWGERCGKRRDVYAGGWDLSLRWVAVDAELEEEIGGHADAGVAGSRANVVVSTWCVEAARA